MSIWLSAVYLILIFCRLCRLKIFVSFELRRYLSIIMDPGDSVELSFFIGLRLRFFQNRTIFFVFCRFCRFFSIW